MKQRPSTMTLDEFVKDFSPEQRRIVEEETRYYYLLTSFREAREKQGITQAELAQSANVDRVTLNRIESGLRNATIGTLDKIAHALGMKLEITVKTA